MTTPTPSNSTVFARVRGTHGTTGVFTFATGVQESVGEDGASISVSCYHTKVYAIDGSVSLNLESGLQEGQVKRVTLVHKGIDSATVTLMCPTLTGNSTQIVFSNVGDQLELIWSGASWSVLCTLNFMEPFLQTPWVS